MPSHPLCRLPPAAGLGVVVVEAVEQGGRGGGVAAGGHNPAPSTQTPFAPPQSFAQSFYAVALERVLWSHFCPKFG